MNTNQLKRFAKEARIKLLNQVGRKLEFVVNNTIQSFIDTFTDQKNSLKNNIEQIGKNLVIVSKQLVEDYLAALRVQYFRIIDEDKRISL
jgi:hypothetical protein